MTRRPPRDRAVTAEESALWRRVVSDAVPLHDHDNASSPDAPVPATPALRAEPPAVTVDLAATSRVSITSVDPVPLPPQGARRGVLPVLSAEAIPGLDRQTDRRLRRGLMVIEGRIDLHGMTQAQAHVAVVAFVERGWHEQRRCLLIITGKGAAGPDGGILRQAVPRWLNEGPLRAIIVGLHRAQSRHGGDGALYVLLKRRRERR